MCRSTNEQPCFPGHYTCSTYYRDTDALLYLACHHERCLGSWNPRVILCLVNAMDTAFKPWPHEHYHALKIRLTVEKKSNRTGSFRHQDLRISSRLNCAGSHPSYYNFEMNAWPSSFAHFYRCGLFDCRDIATVWEDSVGWMRKRRKKRKICIAKYLFPGPVTYSVNQWTEICAHHFCAYFTIQSIDSFVLKKHKVI